LPGRQGDLCFLNTIAFPMSEAPPLGIRPGQWHAADDRSALLVDALLDRHASIVERAPELEERLRASVPDFWEAYASVYGTDHAQIGGVARAVEAALAGFRSRSDRLRALDREREEQPDWFQHQRRIGMMLYVDKFADTLEGLRRRLPYLQELGITHLHLMPLLETREGPDDGGYAVTSFRRVDADLGTMDALRDLARTLHDEGMTLAIDFVMNHTAKEHEWAQRALDGDKRHQALYRMFEDRSLPDAYETSLPEVFPDFAPGNFTHVEALDRWVWTTFYTFQWDLNYANPDVFVHMLREMLFLANVGVDVLRLDAVPFLWKEMGTNCQNRPEAHSLLRAYRALMNVAAPGVLFKAEAIVAPDEIVRYLGTETERDECDIAYNAALMSHLWHALASENVQLLRAMLANLPEPPPHTSWLNYVRAHDDIGWGIADADAAQVGQDGRDTRIFCADYYAGRVPGSPAEGYDFQRDAQTGEARTSGTTAALAGLQRAQIEGDAADVDQAVRRILLLHSVVFAMRGVPQLYSGDEIGLLNDTSYLADREQADDNRWIHRPPMDWEKAALRQHPDRAEHDLFDGLKQLADTRQTTEALHGRASERVLHQGNDRVFAVERARADDRLLALANFAETPQTVALHDLPSAWQMPRFHDALDGDTLHFSGRRIVLPPYAYRWLQPRPAAPRPMVPTTIQVEVHTEWGEEVYLVGSIDALGQGDPDRAAGPLSAHAYPRWTLELEVPDGTWFEFRWLKVRDGHVLETSPHRYAMRAGTATTWTLNDDVA
jgi:amylosucrase